LAKVICQTGTELSPLPDRLCNVEDGEDEFSGIDLEDGRTDDAELENEIDGAFKELLDCLPEDEREGLLESA
jgi:hypothetical protein